MRASYAAYVGYTVRRHRDLAAYRGRCEDMLDVLRADAAEVGMGLFGYTPPSADVVARREREHREAVASQHEGRRRILAGKGIVLRVQGRPSDAR